MSSSHPTHRRIVLTSRPHGAPTEAHFRLEVQPRPQPGEGEILLRTVWLSLDPYMRGRMSDAPSYVPPIAIDAVMGAGTIARIEQSRHADFKEGEWVVSQNGWQDFALSDGRDLQRLPDAAREHPSWGLSLLGMTGFTAYMGLLDIGQPQAGETVVVAAATGAVGSVVGQIARLKGCQVIGIAGGVEKCRYAEQTLGFDRCLNHHDPALAEQLRRACPDGIDVYFENVGGKVFDAVLPLMNARGRIPLCGLIADYNASAPSTLPDRLPLLQSTLLRKRLRIQGFIITQDYPHRFSEFVHQMSQWVTDNRIVLREDVYHGLENAPKIFIDMLEGRNFGKVVVRVAPDQP